MGEDWTSLSKSGCNANKLIYFAYNLDQVYHKTKSIADEHTVKILYFKNNKSQIKQLDDFLTNNNIQTSHFEDKEAGTLLSFDGKEFRAWYEQVHECDTYPQHCDREY